MIEQSEAEYANKSFKDILTSKPPILSPITDPQADEETGRQELSPYTRGVNQKVHFQLSRIISHELIERDRQMTPAPKKVAFLDKALEKRGSRLDKLVAVNDSQLRSSMAGAKL